MAYDVVSYTPDLLPQILQLQTHLWASDPARNAAYLRWKYTDNPFLDELLIRLALVDGRVVAMRGMFGSMWQVDDSPTRQLLPYADDFVVAPEHRNRGVASQIMKATLDGGACRGFPFAISLSAGPVTFINSLAAGWRSAGSYQTVWRFRTVRSLRERVHSRAWSIQWYRRLDALRRGLWPPNPFNDLDREGRQSSGRVSLSREPRPAEMAELIERLPWDGRIRHVRDAAYLAWRFRNPLHEYRFLFWDEGGLQGYLVVQRYLSEHADRWCVNIADWEAADERIRTGLLQAALGWGRFARIHAWTIGVSEPVRELLRAHGFAAAEPGGLEERSRGLLVRRLGDAAPDARWTLGSRNLLNIADWDLRMLYSMAA